MTLLELRQRGFTVGAERSNCGGGTVLVRCACLRWCWAYRSRLIFKARNGHEYRCRTCGEEAQQAKHKEPK